MIELRGVWKTYVMGKVEVNALRGVDLQVERGEFVVVLSPSGCGKTTMLNIISGIDRPTKGRVIFDSRDITDYDDDALTMHRRRNVGFIFQFFNLFQASRVDIVKALRGYVEETFSEGLAVKFDAIINRILRTRLIFRMAVRNLVRNRKRTAISLFSHCCLHVPHPELNGFR
ncbi:MAG: ABC transporter ATP-binding protein [Archaeoglobus sp.]|uniref:ATP-binding cassette domain-containing protein n=1 Tax=Archaeoglobus sp. TaxID=1872626 RepID=UPI001D2998C9|nr:ATP-binding cassette domain-containing protein [Archaeoglobus sp.]MBO8180012.1 ABC transporter ATP-binding protein [Archaeoglobus sp.]